MNHPLTVRAYAPLALALGLLCACGPSLSDEETRVITVEHYKVPCQQCGFACVPRLCLKTTDNGQPFGEFVAIDGFDYHWATRYVLQVTVSTPKSCADCGGPSLTLEEELDAEPQPAGTRFGLDLTAEYLAESTEADLQLMDPSVGHTERQLSCSTVDACAPLRDTMSAADPSQAVAATFGHPADPTQPLVVVVSP